MTNQHPLTDEICQQIAEDKVAWHPDWTVLDPMEKTCMRTAADWQLKQVLEWIDCIGRFKGYNLDFYSDCDLLIRDIQKAMRPQQQRID
jgi:hypothetical protein